MFVLRHTRYLLNRHRELTADINFSGCCFLRYSYKYVRRNYSISFVSHPLLLTLRKTCFTKTKDLRFCPDLTLSFTCSTYFVDGHSLQILTIHTAWKVSAFGVFLVRIFLYSVWMREKTDKKKPKYGDFSGSVSLLCTA